MKCGAWPVVSLGPRVGLPLNVAVSQPGFADLSWQSSTGEYFNIEFSTNLASGFNATSFTNILATSPTNVVTVPLTQQHGVFRRRF